MKTIAAAGGKQGQGGAGDEEVRAEIDGEGAVPGAGVGAREAHALGDPHVQDDAVEAAEGAGRARGQRLARGRLRHVGREERAPPSFRLDQAQRLAGRGLVAIGAGQRRPLPRAQAGDGAAVARGRPGLGARPRPCAHHEDAAADEAPAARGEAPGLRGKRRGLPLALRGSARHDPSMPRRPPGGERSRDWGVARTCGRLPPMPAHGAFAVFYFGPWFVPGRRDCV